MSGETVPSRTLRSERSGTRGWNATQSTKSSGAWTATTMGKDSRKVERAQPEPQPRQRRARRGGGERRSLEELQAIRHWARQQGFQVSDRGRIKADILEKYDSAH